jgi:DNA-binding response OmpR family regulator
MKILLVEDEQQIADYLEMSLSAEYFAVDVAPDGETGMEMALHNNYDLVILDNMLPGKTGIEICRAVRSSGKMYPILILSARSETTTKIELLDAGADDYLSKPFSLQELIARVRALLRRPRRMETTVLSIDDLILDTQRHAVKRGKTEVALTRKEFALLEYLMKNEDSTVSRGMLMEHVWSTSMDPFSNTIESHILSLRKKLNVGTKRRLIHTVSGVGYRLGRNP